ncbi:MAG: sterol desaturase family protein [Sediminibacterium sp.]|nr:sterol desaturase family protein [Sediminibacterium sp.]
MQYFFITIASFIAMEMVAWFTHKYIMHGFLWHLHKDHHKKDQYGFFEKNDYFFLIFAIPGIVCLYIGMQLDYNYFFWIGLGITIYGWCYFLIHDGFIHQRFKILKKINNNYFKAIRRAHKVHHKHLNKEEGECFGMLWVPLKYFKQNASK